MDHVFECLPANLASVGRGLASSPGSLLGSASLAASTSRGPRAYRLYALLRAEVLVLWAVVELGAIGAV
jgi:hypothetical protein